MSYRGRGRGRGRGGGGFPRGGETQVSFELFPENKIIGKAEYSESDADTQLVRWSRNMLKYWSSSPYYYEDRTERPAKMQKPDIEKYSDRRSQATMAKPPLWHFIKMDPDHMPAELARGEKKEKHPVKKVRWNPESDMQKLDVFEKLEEKHQGEEVTVKKENENEEEEDEGGNEEEDGEFSDEGDYEQPEYFDDDEDDFNMPEDNDDQPSF